jgi:hypothetical protein
MWFELAGPIYDIETIAAGPSIRVLPFLRRKYGTARWRKLRGIAKIRLPNGTIRKAELHWYEAHGVGRKNLKFKRYVD